MQEMGKFLLSDCPEWDRWLAKMSGELVNRECPESRQGAAFLLSVICPCSTAYYAPVPHSTLSPKRAFCPQIPDGVGGAAFRL